MDEPVSPFAVLASLQVGVEAAGGRHGLPRPIQAALLRIVCNIVCCALLAFLPSLKGKPAVPYRCRRACLAPFRTRYAVQWLAACVRAEDRADMQTYGLSCMCYAVSGFRWGRQRAHMHRAACLVWLSGCLVVCLPVRRPRPLLFSELPMSCDTAEYGGVGRRHPTPDLACGILLLTEAE